MRGTPISQRRERRLRREAARFLTPLRLQRRRRPETRARPCPDTGTGIGVRGRAALCPWAAVLSGSGPWDPRPRTAWAPGAAEEPRTPGSRLPRSQPRRRRPKRRPLPSHPAAAAEAGRRAGPGRPGRGRERHGGGGGRGAPGPALRARDGPEWGRGPLSREWPGPGPGGLARPARVSPALRRPRASGGAERPGRAGRGRAGAGASAGGAAPSPPRDWEGPGPLSVCGGRGVLGTESFFLHLRPQRPGPLAALSVPPAPGGSFQVTCPR